MLPGGLGIGAANLLGHLRVAAQLLQRVLELGDLLLVLRLQLCPTLNFLRLHLSQHIIVLIGCTQQLPVVGALNLKGVRTVLNLRAQGVHILGALGHLEQIGIYRLVLPGKGAHIRRGLDTKGDGGRQAQNAQHCAHPAKDMGQAIVQPAVGQCRLFQHINHCRQEQQHAGRQQTGDPTGHCPIVGIQALVL